MALGHQLFREEAIEFQRGQREFGDITLLQPVSTRLLGWLLTGVVTIAIVFLCFAQFSRKQTVSGFLVPAAGTLKVYSAREGIVAGVLVKEGEHVAAGDPLFTVMTPQISADGEDINAAKLASFRRQHAMLRHQIAAEQQSAGEERSRLTALIASAQSQIADLGRQLALQKERVQLAGSLVSAVQGLLAKGYMSGVEGKRREDLLLEQRENLASLQRQLTDQQNKLAESQYSLKELPTATARKIQPLRDQTSTIEQQIAEGKGRTSYVVRAPGSGRISMLQVSPGQTAQPQRVQLEIIPDGSPLQAELLIPTRAAGFVRVGEPVRFLYDAFPYQNFGAYTGHLTEVSNTVLTKADAAGPITPEEPVYKAVAVLDRPDVDAKGQKAPLQAGMLLKAELILDRRSLASWIVDPLLQKRF